MKLNCFEHLTCLLDHSPWRPDYADFSMTEVKFEIPFSNTIFPINCGEPEGVSYVTLIKSGLGKYLKGDCQ